MTPLVDITFLLLMFFLFTTTMLKPQVMEMRIPPEIYAEVEVKASELLTISLLEDGRTYWFVGTIDLEKDPNNPNRPQLISIDSIKYLAFEQNLKPNVKNRLITLFSIDEKAKYDLMIAVLDQLNVAEMSIIEELSKETEENEQGELVPIQRKRRFTISVLNDEDKTRLTKTGVEGVSENVN
jgi:biopolymer transport protein ExbD